MKCAFESVRELAKVQVLNMTIILILLVSVLCTLALAEKVELPEWDPTKKLSVEELLKRAEDNPGLSYLFNNETLNGIDPTNIHPDILEDSILLTVSHFVVSIKQFFTHILY